MNNSDKNNTNTNGGVEIFSTEKALLLDHNYDGIRELDHVLPRWWVWLLYATIVFSVWYSGYYMLGSGPTPEQELAEEMTRIEALKPPTNAGGLPEAASLVSALGDTSRANHGREVYLGKCVACHGDHGQGTIGPNLTDEFWIHGGAPTDVARIVAVGVPEKGMPPWGPLLSPDELTDLVVFIDSIKGSNPAGAKAAQGEKYDAKN